MQQEKNKKLKVLYIYAGERRETERLWKEGKMPDTYLLGLNYIKDFDIDADYIETPLINKLRKINFNLAALPLIFKARKYDIVFSGGSLFFPFLFRVVLRMKKTKLVWYNTFFTNAIKRSSGLKKRIILKTMKSLDGIVCPSKAQYDFLLSQGVDKDKLFFVLNGVDVAYIQKKQRDIKPAEEDYILSVGKDMGRDYETLIDAVKNIGMKVKIVAMPRNINTADLPKNVEFLGSVPFDELLGLYKNAKLIVIPTKSEESLDASDCSGQYVLLDSLASGKAIIASKRNSLKDYVDNMKDVFLVEPEDSDDLQTAIKFLLDNPEKVKEMERNTRRKSGLFTTRNFAKQLVFCVFDKVAKK